MCLVGDPRQMEHQPGAGSVSVLNEVQSNAPYKMPSPPASHSLKNCSFPQLEVTLDQGTALAQQWAYMLMKLETDLWAKIHRTKYCPHSLPKQEARPGSDSSETEEH